MLHALLKVLMRPFSPLTEDCSHLGTPHRVHGIARNSVLSLLVSHIGFPDSEVGQIILSMYSLVEESLHELLLLGLSIYQVINFSALGGDAFVSLIKPVHRSRGVLV